jgi:hypothetical protein
VFRHQVRGKDRQTQTNASKDVLKRFLISGKKRDSETVFLGGKTEKNRKNGTITARFSFLQNKTVSVSRTQSQKQDNDWRQSGERKTGGIFLYP